MRQVEKLFGAAAPTTDDENHHMHEIGKKHATGTGVV